MSWHKVQDQTKRIIAFFIGLVVALIILVLGDINTTQTLMLAVAGFVGGTIAVYFALKFLLPTSAPKPPKPRQRAKRPTSKLAELERELAEEMEEEELKEEISGEEAPEEEAAPPPPRSPPPTRTSKKKKSSKPRDEEDWDAMDVDMG